MKYLAEPKLDQLSTLLSTAASSPSGAAEAKVTVKFELYSVKQLREDRKMVKEREEMYMSEQEGMDEMSFSPEMKEAGLSSCFGRLDEKESRKVHYLLVQCLNSAFPEHDFAALQPEHFTREPNAGIVLEQLSGRLLYKTTAFPQLATSHSSPLLRPVGSAPGSSPFSSSPSHAHAPLGPAGDLYKSLCDVVPLDECDVYSWLPSPEYDPHVEPEEGELGDDWYNYSYGDEGDGAMDDMDVDMDMDVDEPSQTSRHDGEGEAMWGNAGMEIEEEVIPLHGGGVEVAKIDSKGKRRTSDMPPPALPPSGTAMVKRPSVDDEMMGLERTGGGLLWSANYFFYSKRNKRILFVTTWSRRRPAPRSYAMAPIESAFPETISSSSMSTSASAQLPPSPLAPRRYKTRTKSRHKPHARPSMGNGSGSGSGSGHGHITASGSGTNKQRGFPGPSSVGRSHHGLGMGTIPIRSAATPPRATGLLPQTPSGSGRLASSAPNSSFGSSAGITMTSPIATPGAMSRMTAGGFKPKPHGAIRTGGFSPSHAASGTRRPSGGVAAMTGTSLGSSGNRQSGIGAGLASFAASGDAMRQADPTIGSAGTASSIEAREATGEAGEEASGQSRVRKDRSESTTPGPSLMRSGAATGVVEGGMGAGASGTGDKRVKV